MCKPTVPLPPFQPIYTNRSPTLTLPPFCLHIQLTPHQCSMLHKQIQAFRSHKASSKCSRPPAVRIQCSSLPNRPAQSQQNTASEPSSRDRRDFLLQLAVGLPAAASLLSAGPAAAENVVAAFLKSRRTANGGAKLLNPLYVAQRRLQEASALLSQNAEPAAEDLTTALQLVRSSSLNCYIFEALPDDTFETRASLLTQKYELSVSSCYLGTVHLLTKSQAVTGARSGCTLHRHGFRHCSNALSPVRLSIAILPFES